MKYRNASLRFSAFPFSASHHVGLPRFAMRFADGGGSGGAGAGGAAASGTDGNAGAGDQGGEDDKGGQPGTDGDAGGKVELPKTQEELAALLKSETDKQVSGAVEAAKAKWDADQKVKADEAAKLAKLDAAGKEKFKLDKREKELSQRETEVTRRELKAGAIKILADANIPNASELAENLVYTDADACNASIERLKTAFSKAVEIGVNDRLKGHSPFTAGGKADGKGDSVAQRLIELNKKSAGTAKKTEDYYFKH